VWQVVDARERPDVLDSPDGPDGFGPGLCWAACEGCGAREHIEAPVLVLRPGAAVPALFATSVAELQADASATAAGLVDRAADCCPSRSPAMCTGTWPTPRRRAGN
jgi:hypothetical protein